MPRFFFDINNGGWSARDDIGQELADPEAARVEALRALPEIARDELPKDGDRQTLVVLVTDEEGRPVYSGSLSYTGLWLLR